MVRDDSAIAKILADSHTSVYEEVRLVFKFASFLSIPASCQDDRLF